MVKDRASRVRDLLDRCELDAMIFLDLANIRYLCGFTGTDGVLLVTADRSWFLTDSRYTTQAHRQVAADEIREYRIKLDGLIGGLRELGAAKVGFEADFVPFATVQKLQSGAPDIAWHPLGAELKPLRGTKDEEELATLAEATRLNAIAFAEILPQIRPGVTEREIALALEFALKRQGGENLAFDFIVASGSRGAMPHGVASDKLLAAGELVTIDFGVRYRGYHSDETVTVAIREVPSKLREIYSIVLEAHDRAIDAVRPGISLADIDAVARDYIAVQGYGDYFGHGLGHGVGLEVHEYPTVSARGEAVAEVGMVFTIEPGIYIPDLAGVRIEDMVTVTADGCRLLTRLPKGFQSLSV